MRRTRRREGVAGGAKRPRVAGYTGTMGRSGTARYSRITGCSLIAGLRDLAGVTDCRKASGTGPPVIGPTVAAPTVERVRRRNPGDTLRPGPPSPGTASPRLAELVAGHLAGFPELLPRQLLPERLLPKRLVPVLRGLGSPASSPPVLRWPPVHTRVPGIRRLRTRKE